MLRYSVRAPNPDRERRGAFINVEHILPGWRCVSEDSMTRRKIHTALQSHVFVMKAHPRARLLPGEAPPGVPRHSDRERSGLGRGNIPLGVLRCVPGPNGPGCPRRMGDGPRNENSPRDLQLVLLPSLPVIPQSLPPADFTTIAQFLRNP